MVFARVASRSLRPSTFSSFASVSPQCARRAAQPSIHSTIAKRTLTASASRQGKVLLVLYDVSPTNLYSPPTSSIISLTTTSQGHEHAKDQPRLLGTTENELGIRKWLEDQGHTLVTTSDKEGENSEFDKHLVDAEVIITTP